MYNLIFVTATALLGSYHDLPSCQAAIRDIFVAKINPYNFKSPDMEKAINTRVSFQREYICLPNKKID